MTAPVWFSLGALAVVAATVAGKVLGQVLFNRSVMYPQQVTPKEG